MLLILFDKPPILIYKTNKMDKINIVLHTEVVECLRPLDDETLSKIMRMIFDWNDGIEVEPITQVEKFAWAFVLPKLERNKETYLSTLETRRKVGRENGSKGGAPKGNQNARKQPKTTELVDNVDKNNPNNPNLNLYNTSKEVLYIEEVDRDLQPEPLDGGSVGTEGFSKGMEKLEQIFPQQKRDNGMTEEIMFGKLTQSQKANLIKKAVLYIRKESQNQDGKFIKKLSKWMSEEIGKGIPEEIKPTVKKELLTFSRSGFQDANMIVYLQSIFDSDREADSVYHKLNRLGYTQQELYNIAKTYKKEQILNLIKN